jgi:thioredoxin-dependent peroxiredoxin
MVSSADELGPGSVAPDFSLPSSTGKVVSLHGLRGKKVVLYFYPADDTPGCTKEACSFRDNMPDFQKLDAVVLGVSKDPIDSHQAFIKKYGLNFTLLSDEDLTVHRLYDTWREKNMYGKKFMGTERSTFVIDEKGRIARVFRKVRVDGHEKEVLEALAS